MKLICHFEVSLNSTNDVFMKTIVLFFLLAFTAISACSQTISKDSLIKKMAAEMCVQIAANDSALRTAENFQMKLGVMMLPVMTSYKEELAKVIPGFVFENDLESLSEQLGMTMALNCPSFLNLIAARPEFLNEVDQNPERAVEGKLVQILDGDFTSIQVKLSNGRTEKLWWMEFFEGAEALASKSLVSKQVKVKFVEKEVYNAALKDYILIKVITGIDKK